jgi:hypothetical protein
MAAILEKRTSEDVWYDIDCTDALNEDETIVSVASVEADEEGLTFGAPAVNAEDIEYSDGRVGAEGKVIQVKIAGGIIPAGKRAKQYTIRAVFSTSAGDNTREATVLLNVTDDA